MQKMNTDVQMYRCTYHSDWGTQILRQALGTNVHQPRTHIKKHYNKCYKAFKVKVKCHDTKSKASHLGSYILLYVIISVLCLFSSTIT